MENNLEIKDGIIIVNKKKGITSRKVVEKIAKKYNVKARTHRNFRSFS